MHRRLDLLPGRVAGREGCVSLTFTKLFSSITESTIWMEPHATRLVWITMLAMTDANGFVFGSVPGLAHRARVTVEECREALRTLLEPDPDSRTPDHEGRRVAVIDGGWQLLNHAKYRRILSVESIRESKRDHMRRVRAKASTVEPSGKSGNTPSASGSGSPSESGSDPDPERAPARRNTVPDEWSPNEGHEARCQELGVDFESTVRSFREHEFNRAYGDWDRRFSKWITDQRVRAESAKPVGKFKFRKEWRPRDPEHRAYGHKHGLTDDEMKDLAEHCRNKLFPSAFDSEDEQFKREILWFRDQKRRKANPHGLNENPGARRRPGDTPPTPVFGRRGAG